MIIKHIHSDNYWNKIDATSWHVLAITDRSTDSSCIISLKNNNNNNKTIDHNVNFFNLESGSVGSYNRLFIISVIQSHEFEPAAAIGLSLGAT